jgi:muconolactone delta-isomerase
MQFMISVVVNPEKANAPPPKELVEAEFEAVRSRYMDGFIRQIWLRADHSGGIILAEADSQETVAETFAALPMVRAGVLQKPDVVALAPYWGFAPRG